MATLFSEANQDWRPIPSWVRLLINLGYKWPYRAAGTRRIALISMPGDSAGAPLIALGALIRDLGNPEANDLGAHFDSLLRHGRQYIEHCHDCTCHCEPQITNCGYLAEAHGQIRS